MNDTITTPNDFILVFDATVKECDVFAIVGFLTIFVNVWIDMQFTQLPVSIKLYVTVFDLGNCTRTTLLLLKLTSTFFDLRLKLMRL